MQVQRFRVNSIRCGGCERTILDGLLEVAGVEHVAPDARADEVEVRFDPAVVDEGRIDARLQELGFTPVTEEEPAPAATMSSGGAQFALLVVAVAAVALAGYSGYVLYPRFELPAVVPRAGAFRRHIRQNLPV